MEGVLAEGQLEVMIIPTGSQGNDRDIRVVTESWTVPDLRIVVYRKSSDPRSGDNTMRLSNISRNEPDPQLFLPPADYQVVEETGPFTIHYAQKEHLSGLGVLRRDVTMAAFRHTQFP